MNSNADATKKRHQIKLRLKNRSVKLAAFFTIHIFVLLAVSLFLSALIIHCLFAFGILANPRPELLIVLLCVTALVLGVGLSRIASRDVLASIIKTSEAAKEVAAGNFNTRLDVKSHAEEMNTLAKSFNRMAAELERSEMLSADFVNNVSHEFKTPLAAIEGYATLLQSPTLSPGKQEFYTEKILLATRKLTDLTSSILELSRLENSELVLKRTPFSLDEQIRECILISEGAWSQKNIALDIDLCEMDFNGNADILAHVWHNLIGNAVKFSPEGGIVSISLTESHGAHGKEAIFRVTDDGPGITAEQHERIFEKFYQGDASHSEEGSGLGLTLAKRAVEVHGGSIQAESTPGRGSTFLVVLPEQTV